MKKFGMLMLVLSMFGYTVGCGGAADSTSSDTNGATATDSSDDSSDADTAAEGE